MGGANKVQRSEAVNPPPRFLHGRCARSPFDGRAPVRRMGALQGKTVPPSAAARSIPALLRPHRHHCRRIPAACPGSRAYSIILKERGSPLEACHPWAERSLGSLAIENVPKPAPVRRNGPTLGTPLWKSRPPNLHTLIAPFPAPTRTVCPASSQCAAGAGQARRTEYTRHPTIGTTH